MRWSVQSLGEVLQLGDQVRVGDRLVHQEELALLVEATAIGF